jgi:hypothetical protein
MFVMIMIIWLFQFAQPNSGSAWSWLNIWLADQIKTCQLVLLTNIEDFHANRQCFFISNRSSFIRMVKTNSLVIAETTLAWEWGCSNPWKLPFPCPQAGCRWVHLTDPQSSNLEVTVQGLCWTRDFSLELIIKRLEQTTLINRYLDALYTCQLSTSLYLVFLNSATVNGSMPSKLKNVLEPTWPCRSVGRALN